MPTIALVNTYDATLDDQLNALAKALQVHHDDHFSKHWGTGYKFLHAPLGRDVPDDVWPLNIAATAQEPGALGWHAEKKGIPYGVIGAKDDLDSGNRLDVTIGHEAWELAVNMAVNKTCLFNTPIGGFRGGLLVVGAYEVSDASEAEQFAMDAGGGIKIADWAYRWFFGGGVPDEYAGRFSHSGALTESFSIDRRGGVHGLRKGGYLGIMQVRGLGGWTTVNARFTDEGQELEAKLAEMLPGEGVHIVQEDGTPQVQKDIPPFSRRGRIIRAMAS